MSQGVGFRVLNHGDIFIIGITVNRGCVLGALNTLTESA